MVPNRSLPYFTCPWQILFQLHLMEHYNIHHFDIIIKFVEFCLKTYPENVITKNVVEKILCFNRMHENKV